MGRPAWATEDQWVWLKAQVLEYLKIKGTKETTKFWGPFLNEWQTKWPTPALTDIVQTGNGSDSTGESPTDASETPAKPQQVVMNPQTLSVQNQLNLQSQKNL